MSLLKSIFSSPVFAVILVASAVGGAALLVAESPPAPCVEPIQYTIGEVDQRFEFSQEDFRVATRDAAALWNDAAGKQLFVEVPNADLVILMQYDDRQKATDIARQIDRAQEGASGSKQRVAALRADLDQRAAAYEARVAAFNTRAAAYEKDVVYWNARGGAPAGEFERLAQERRALERVEGDLRSESRELDTLASTIGTQAATVNEDIDRLNQQVEQFNASVPEEFEQGYYAENETGKRIVIFESESRDELVWVLAHELGHALGIDHVSDPQAIMAAYNAKSVPALTGADRAALAVACAE